MRIRTIPVAVAELKQVDPDCAIGYKTIRRLITDGTLQEVKVGTKNLVDLDKLEELFLKKGETQ